MLTSSTAIQMALYALVLGAGWAIKHIQVSGKTPTPTPPGAPTAPQGLGQILLQKLEEMLLNAGHSALDSLAAQVVQPTVPLVVPPVHPSVAPAVVAPAKP